LESTLAAFPLGNPKGLAGVAFHAFEASTPIHTLILVLWFGLVANAIILYATITPVALAIKRRQRLMRETQFLSSLSRLLPMLGFLGTVLGLAAAIATLAVHSGDEGRLTSASLISLFSSLAVKFETSFLGLAASITMTFLFAMIEARWRILSERPARAALHD
jgi:hypothetical protein